MAFAQELFDKKLYTTLRKIEKNPSKEAEYRKEYALWVLDYIGKRVKDAQEQVILTMCQNLYQADYTSLRADLAKICFMQLEKDATEKERVELLRCLIGSINIYLKNDYSAILNPVSNTAIINELMEETDNDDRLPFN